MTAGMLTAPVMMRRRLLARPGRLRHPRWVAVKIRRSDPPASAIAEPRPPRACLGIGVKERRP